MFIISYMTPSPVTIGPDETVVAAVDLLEGHDFRHLPVVDGMGRLLGMITDRDLRSACPSSVLSTSEQELILDRVKDTKVRQIMSTDLACLHPDSTLDDALLLFRHHRIGALPVVAEEERLVGILSLNDLMDAYSDLFGLGEKGSTLLALEVPGRGVALAGLVAVLEKNNIRCTRLIRTGGTGRDPARIYLRLSSCNMVLVRKLIRKAGFSLYQPPDIRE